MEKWEYKTKRKSIFSSPILTNEWLNELGEDGWELCGKRDFNQYIFKRKLTPKEK